MKNLNTILPFYESLADQNSSKEYVDNECALVCEQNRLLPFVLRRLRDLAGLTGVTLGIYDSSTDILELSLTPVSTYLDLSGVIGDSYEYLSYNETLLSSNLDLSKTYYLKLYDNTQYWYSEKFIVRKTMTNYITLKFENAKVLNNVKSNYEQKLYIDQVLKTPEYVRFDDAEEKNGIKIYRSQILQKANILRIMATPEYLVDCLMQLPLMDSVSLYLQNGDEIDVQQVDVDDPDWTAENKGSTALLTISLIEYTIIKKLNFTEMGCSDTTSSIRQGVASLTSMVSVTIVFSSTLALGYSVSGKAQDSSGNTVIVSISNLTTSGFDAISNADCTFYWTAIKE